MGRRLAIEIFLMLAAGLLLAFIGPFGTWDMPLMARLMLWPAMILSGYPIFRGLGTVSGWLSEATHIPPPIALLLALAIGALPMTFIVALLWMGASPGEAVRWRGLGMLYAQVFLIGLVIHGAMSLLFRARAEEASDAPASAVPSAAEAARDPSLIAEAPAAAPAPTPSPAPAPPTPLVLPLPPGFGAVHALKGEDHYVRVYGEGGDTLILMRLRDAIARLGADAAAQGMQVHRSWWVARDAVASIRRDGRSATLLLKNGTVVTAARDAMPKLRAAGWL